MQSFCRVFFYHWEKKNCSLGFAPVHFACNSLVSEQSTRKADASISLMSQPFVDSASRANPDLRSLACWIGLVSVGRGIVTVGGISCTIISHALLLPGRHWLLPNFRLVVSRCHPVFCYKLPSLAGEIYVASIPRYVDAFGYALYQAKWRLNLWVWASRIVEPYRNEWQNLWRTLW